jgi:hypothetical protein
MEKITVGIVNFNGLATLPETLASVRALDYPAVELIVADACSTDGSLEWLRRYHPDVRCVSTGANRGPAGARNLVLREARTRLALILDNDVVLEPDSLSRLVAARERVPEAAVVHLEIKDRADPQAQTHYNGGWIHYLCVHIPRSYANGDRPPYEIFDTVSGAGILVDREAAARVGGFDEDFEFGWEDGDFTVRLTLAGYLCLNVPGAVGYHSSKPRGLSRAFYQVRNRWFFILKLYSWRTVLLAAPMLVFFEASQAVWLTAKGAAGDYWRGNAAVLRALPRVLRKRRAFQRLKAKRDRDWLRSGDLYVPDALLGDGAGRILKEAYRGMFALYWRAIRPFC